MMLIVRRIVDFLKYTLPVLLLLCASSTARSQMLYDITDLAERDEFVFSAVKINKHGHYVGMLRKTEPQITLRGYFRGADSLSEIPTFGGSVSWANSINDSGTVVGYAYTTATEFRAFRWQAGQITNLGTLDGFYRSAAYGINNRGVIVGHLMNNVSSARNRAFRWENGTMQEMSILADSGDASAHAINDDGVIVGSSWKIADFNRIRPVKWVNGTISDLGTLAEDVHGSAYDINAAGTIMGGSQTQTGGDRAVIWENGQIRSLGHLGDDRSIASAINDSGDVVGVSNGVAFLWRGGTMYDVNTLIDTSSGWRVIGARDIGNKGEILGFGTQGGPVRSLLLTPVPFILKRPTGAPLLVGGEPDTIRWLAAPSIQNVHIRFSSDSGATFTNLTDAPIAANTGQFVWTVPDSIMSAKCIIEIYNTNVDFQDQFVRSKSFTVKGYRLARLDSDSEFEAFEPRKHGWRFSNSRSNMFPAQWVQQFNYASGEDPFTEDDYPDWFTEPSINAMPAFFPDWPAYVRAFGTDEAYHLLVDGFYGIYREAAAEKWAGLRAGAGWGGSCSGFAISSMLAFAHKDDFNAAYADINAPDSLYSLTGSTLGTTTAAHNSIRERINQLYIHWWGRAAKDHVRVVRNNTPRQSLAALKAAFLDLTNTTPGYLYISNVGGSGAHAVVPYRMQRSPANPGRIWRVYVYDPNRPGDAARFVTIDSTANTWSYPLSATRTWGGATGMYMMNGVRDHLTVAVNPDNTARAFKSLVTPPSAEPAANSELEVFVTPGATTNIAGASGAIGYADSVIFNTIPGAYANNPPTGFETPPVGYLLPYGSYSIELTGTPEEHATVSIFSDSLIYAYSRAATSSEERDLLRFEDSKLMFSNPNEAAQTFMLKGISIVDNEERVTEIREMRLSQSDSVALDVSGNGLAEVVNYGGATEYSVRLRRTNPDSSVGYFHASIGLTPGTRHELRPDWTAPTLDTIQVLIDQGNDGSVDDTLRLAGQRQIGTSIEAPEPGGPPVQFALYQNYPNPFNPATNIRFSLPRESFVTVRIYDVRGAVVDQIGRGVLSAGWHEFTWDATTAPSGVYFYELRAETVGTAQEFRQHRKMLLVK